MVRVDKARLVRDRTSGAMIRAPCSQAQIIASLSASALPERHSASLSGDDHGPRENRHGFAARREEDGIPVEKPQRTGL